MARTDTLNDHGTVLSLAAATIVNTYTAGAQQISPGQPSRLSVFVAVTGKSATSLTAITLKLQVADVLGSWYDAVTTLNDATGTTVIEQSLSVTASTTLYYLLQSENLAPSVGGWRISAKANTTGSGADAVLVKAVTQ